VGAKQQLAVPLTEGNLEEPVVYTLVW
jgi:hypothetical protein